MITAEERDRIFRGIWRRDVGLFNLPFSLYDDTRTELGRGLNIGFGGKTEDFAFESPDFKTLKALERNIQKFSAAKTFQNVRDTQNLIFDQQGFIRSFSEFKVDALKIYDQYNVNWLQTEFDTVVAQAQSASQWNDIQREKRALPLLKYVTAGDSRVRPEHRAWDGIVKPVDDPFWDTRMPVNSYGCRCVAIQLEAEEEKVTNLEKHLTKVKKTTGVTSLKNTDRVFATNVGKTKFAFDETGGNVHPYFQVPRTFSDLKRTNFNLPLDD